MEIIIDSFERWFLGYHLTNKDMIIIILSILMRISIIIFVIVLAYISIQSFLGTRIGRGCGIYGLIYLPCQVLFHKKNSGTQLMRESRKL